MCWSTTQSLQRLAGFLTVQSLDWSCLNHEHRSCTNNCPGFNLKKKKRCNNVVPNQGRVSYWSENFGLKSSFHGFCYLMPFMGCWRESAATRFSQHHVRYITSGRWRKEAAQPKSESFREIVVFYCPTNGPLIEKSRLSLRFTVFHEDQSTFHTVGTFCSSCNLFRNYSSYTLAIFLQIQRT